MPAMFSNNASTTLAASITNSVTSLTVATGTGALFPALTGSQYFYATLVDLSNDIEIVKVTGRSSDTFTIVRGQEGTTALAYASGSKVELRVTAAGLANKVAYDDSTFTVTEAQVTGLVAALASLAANQIPSGSMTVWHGASAPLGWTQITTYNDLAMRVVSGSGIGHNTSGQAFSSAVANGTVNTHALTQAELPNCNFVVTDPEHQHPIGGLQPASGGGAFLAYSNTGSGYDTGNAPTDITVASGGSGTAHGHGWTAGSLNLNYIDFTLCSKN